MTSLPLDPEFCERLSFALMHSSWVILGVVCVSLLIIDFPRKWSSQARYLCLLSAHFLCLAVFCSLFSIATGNSAVPSPANPANGEDVQTDNGAWQQIHTAKSQEVRPSTPAKIGVMTRMPGTYVATMLYLVGSGLMLLRLLAGLYGGMRYVKASEPVTESHILVAIAKAAKAMRLRYIPAVAYCSSVVVPSVVGVVRPTLLLPFSVLAGLSAREIELLVMHEVAHIRRNDHLFNLLQRIVSAILFFHPALWYLSRRIAQEREMCCDDMVVTAGGKVDNYVRSLIRMAEIGIENGLSDTIVVKLAATGDRFSLRARIVRLLGERQAPPIHLRRSAAAFVTTATLCCFVVASTLSVFTHNVLKSAKVDNAELPVSSIVGYEKVAPADWSTLNKAVAYGTLQEVSMLLKAGLNPSAPQHGGWTPLHFAAALNRREIITLLLSNGADPNAQSEEGRTPLHAAMGLGPTIRGSKRIFENETVKSLLDGGASPNTPDLNGLSPLHDAALFHHVDAVRMFLDKNGDVSAVDANGRTPLHHACSVADPEIIKLLLSHGAKSNAIDARGLTALDLLGFQTRQWTEDASDRIDESAKLLTSAGATAGLAASVSLGFLDAVRGELDTDPGKINSLPAKNVDGNRLLHWAALTGNAQMCQFLIDRGADVNSLNSAGESALYLVCTRLKPAVDVVQILIKAGAAVNQTGKGGAPLFVAAVKSSPEIVQILLDAGAKADYISESGQTLLHRVAFIEASTPHPAHLAIAKLLFEHGCDPNLIAHAGNTSLHLAVSASAEKLVEYLLSVGADPNIVDRTGRTPLMIAFSAEYPNKTIIELLLKYGAESKAQDAGSHTTVGGNVN